MLLSIGTASMRPRSEDRGEHLKEGEKSSVVGGASMRPRSEDRGEPQGRLQCGHGPKTVENNQLQHVLRVDPRRFNAATVRRPWRTAVHRRGSNAVVAASMRPRSEDRGELV